MNNQRRHSSPVRNPKNHPSARRNNRKEPVVLLHTQPPLQRRTTTARCKAWMVLCALSFCTALFLVGCINTLLLHQQIIMWRNDSYYYNNNNNNYHYSLRRQQQRQQQQHFRAGTKERLRGRADQEDIVPRQVQVARAWEEEAAFGVEDDRERRPSDAAQSLSEQQQQQQSLLSPREASNGRPPKIRMAQQQYADMVEARRQDRRDRMQHYDVQRQEHRKEIRRSAVAKRVAGGVFFDPKASAVAEEDYSRSWFSSWWWWWDGGNRNNRDKGPSIYNAADIPVEDFRRHQEALIQSWEKEGIFWNYAQPAIPTADTLPWPTVRPEQESSSSSSLVVIVLSTRHKSELRRVIRETWGRGHVVYFVVGGRSPTNNNTTDDTELEAALRREANEYGDILDTIHPESYKSLPYKLRFAYQFVTRELPQTQWVLKVDEDMFARIATLEKVLLHKLNPQHPFVLGKIVPHAKVSRVGKWAEYVYPERYYPFWPKGSHGHVLSRPVVEYVANLPNVTYYQGEDTSLGIWLSDAPLAVTWIHSPYFQNHGRCEEDDWIVIGHQLSADHMRECYEKLDEWDAARRHDPARNYWHVETQAQRKWMEQVLRQERHDALRSTDYYYDY